MFWFTFLEVSLLPLSGGIRSARLHALIVGAETIRVATSAGVSKGEAIFVLDTVVKHLKVVSPRARMVAVSAS